MDYTLFYNAFLELGSVKGQNVLIIPQKNKNEDGKSNYNNININDNINNDMNDLDDNEENEELNNKLKDILNKNNENTEKNKNNEINEKLSTISNHTILKYFLISIIIITSLLMSILIIKKILLKFSERKINEYVIINHNSEYGSIDKEINNKNSQRYYIQNEQNP